MVTVSLALWLLLPPLPPPQAASDAAAIAAVTATPIRLVNRFMSVLAPSPKTEGRVRAGPARPRHRPGSGANDAVRVTTASGTMPLNGKQLWSPPHPERAGDTPVTSASAEPTRVRGRRPPQGDPVVDRAFALLAAFDAGHRSLTLGELSRRSGIPTSSTLRLAGRLQAWGALERGADGRFTIGLRLWEVASLAPRGQGLKQVALLFMGALEEVTRQHVLLAVREGNEALLVERLSAHGAMAVLYRVGGR